VAPVERPPLAAFTGYDLRVGGRAFALALIAFVVAALVTAATDEGNVAWGIRAGRTLPIAPACAALGTLIAIVPARARGEVRALEALGRAPWQAALGAVAGGVTAALVAAAAMASIRAIDVTGFFPVAARGADYRFADGAFVDATGALRVAADGTLAHIGDAAESAASGLPEHGRAAAALATALSGLALPLLLARLLVTRPLPETGRTTRDERQRVLAAAGLTAASAIAAIILFHAAAARRIPALVAACPTALLLAGALAYYGGAVWPRRE
jgi:hypothetical protein